MMGCWQRRIGPLNLGLIGMAPTFINGFNSIISHIIVPNLHYSFLFQCCPVIYLILCFLSYYLPYPLYIYDLYISLLIIIFISGGSIIFIPFASFSGRSKYSILGPTRIISQFICFEFIFSCIYYYCIFRYFSLWPTTFLWELLRAHQFDVLVAVGIAVIDVAEVE